MPNRPDDLRKQRVLKNPDVREVLAANGMSVIRCGWCQKLFLEGGCGTWAGEWGQVCGDCWKIFA